jgi:hypothetical protein
MTGGNDSVVFEEFALKRLCLGVLGCERRNALAAPKAGSRNREVAFIVVRDDREEIAFVGVRDGESWKRDEATAGREGVRAGGVKRVRRENRQLIERNNAAVS